MRVIVKGAIGASQIRTFYCQPCKAYFEAFTRRPSAESDFEQRTHTCGQLCSTAKTPPPGTKMAIRGGEWNAVGDFKADFQRYWNLTDNQMAKVTRADMDRVMKKNGLQFVDRSWDENRNGGRRERGEAVELPPLTDDPRQVDAYNEKKHGADFVRDGKERSRTAFEAMKRGDPPPALPEAKEVDVHDTPHVIDVDKTIETVAKAPVVTPERRAALQGKVVTGR